MRSAPWPVYVMALPSGPAWWGGGVCEACRFFSENGILDEFWDQQSTRATRRVVVFVTCAPCLSRSAHAGTHARRSVPTGAHGTRSGRYSMRELRPTRYVTRY